VVAVAVGWAFTVDATVGSPAGTEPVPGTGLDMELGAADAATPLCVCAREVRADPKTSNPAAATVKYFNPNCPRIKYVVILLV
jgi:hypothetical protein